MATIDATKAPTTTELPPVSVPVEAAKKEIFDKEKIYTITELYYIVLEFMTDNQKDYQARIRLVNKDKVQVTDAISDMSDDSQTASTSLANRYHTIHVIGAVALFGSAFMPGACNKTVDGLAWAINKTGLESMGIPGLSNLSGMIAQIKLPEINAVTKDDWGVDVPSEANAQRFSMDARNAFINTITQMIQSSELKQSFSSDLQSKPKVIEIEQGIQQQLNQQLGQMLQDLNQAISGQDQARSGLKLF